MKCEKSGNHTISYQSLLLSTTVLNDNYVIYSFYAGYTINKLVNVGNTHAVYVVVMNVMVVSYHALNIRNFLVNKILQCTHVQRL